MDVLDCSLSRNSPPSDPLRRRPRRAAAAAVAALCMQLASDAAAQIAASSSHDELTIEEILTTPIEELMRVQVTTVAGVEGSWFDAPAALEVLTGEDLRRTGHRTVADALRAVPGVFVGNQDAHRWIIGMRGFSGGLANKTLVLIDGRAVYDPLFAGTFWDVQDVLLDDVDRIEVIRGPGATLWGANAVNGVINVITKAAKETQGALVRGGAGNEEHGFGTARYGGRVGERSWYRGWGKYFARDDFRLSDGESAQDEWQMAHGGGRVDVEAGENTIVTVQGDAYDLDFDVRVNPPVPGAHMQFAPRDDDGWAQGGNLLVRATHRLGPTSGFTLQTYYDRTVRRLSSDFGVERDTADVDFRHDFRIGESHQIVWGLGYRFSTDETEVGETVRLDPRSRDLDTYSGFIQDTVTIVPGRLFAMVGSKLDHNTYTGFEVQPSARAWWTPDERNTLWAAVSRPVRVPSRIEHDGTLTFLYVDTGIAAGGEPSGVIVPLTVEGNPELESERVLAYELGYRRKVTDDLMVDAAAFFNDYSRLIFVPDTTFGAWSDDGSGETYGGEIAARWQATERWQVDASYSYVDVAIHGDVLRQDEDNAPHNLVKSRSYLDLTRNLELNVAAYYTDRRPTSDADAYVRLDTGVTWRPREQLELSIWGQNLLERTHNEASPAVEVERSGYVSVTLRF